MYYALLIDLTVMSTEVVLALLALAAVILTFSATLSALNYDQDDFDGIDAGLLSFCKLIVGMLSGEDYKGYRDDPLRPHWRDCLYLLTMVFLLSLLVAQLTCAYGSVYADMVEWIWETCTGVAEAQSDCRRVHCNTQ